MSAATHIEPNLYIKKMSNTEAQFRNIHQDLIDGCKIGDTKAQFQIYKLYYKTMYNTSLRIVNDSMEAEDIMQEAFLSAFEKIDFYSGTVSFGSWLKKIVVNRSLDVLSKRKEIFENIDFHEEIKDESEDETAKREELDVKVEEIKEAIDALPDGYRVIISLYLLEGYDHDEIAKIMSITSSASRSQLSRAKQKLINDLKKKEKIAL